MRRLHRKNLYTQDNSLETRVQQLERRFATPELEYVLVNFSGGTGTYNSGSTTQLTMTDDEFPIGQYGSALNPTPGENVYGYSVIDDYIQCNSFRKQGFWHLRAAFNVETNSPAVFEDVTQFQLFIGMSTFDEDNNFVSDLSHVYSFRGIDNRTDLSGDKVQLRTETMFHNTGILTGERARFYAKFINNSASNITGTPRNFNLIRYGNAIGTITNQGG